MMKREYKENISQWVNEKRQWNLVLSNDIDSLVSCKLLHEYNGSEIRYFYNFNSLYMENGLDYKNDRTNRCWVDTAYVKGNERCFDNHVSYPSYYCNINFMCMNPNIIDRVTNQNYTSKYAGSTALFLWSLLDRPLPKTEEGKMLLLCIDSAFLGFYDDRFKDIQKRYLVDMLGFDELYEVIKKHKKIHFDRLIKKYSLKKIIEYDYDIEDLNTEMDLDNISKLLDLELSIISIKNYHLEKSYRVEEKYIGAREKLSELEKGIVTAAFTYSGQIRYSVEVPIVTYETKTIYIKAKERE